MLEKSALLLAGLAMMTGCGAAGNAATPLLRAPEYAPPDQAKARVRADPLRPLVVEWPNAERGALEAQAKRGLVPVHYVDGQMSLLPSCSVAAPYRYQGTETKLEHVVMRTTDETAANLPVYGASFNARLATAGALVVDMRIVGRYEAPPQKLLVDLIGGDCRGITHVVSALTVGAFDFYTAADASVGGGASVAGAGASGTSQARRETLNRDGEEAACARARSSDPRAPEGCRAVLRLELTSIEISEERKAWRCSGDDFESCERSCSAGSPVACAKVARMHSLGEGAPKDLARSLELYDRACRDGYSVACTNLGLAYLTGKGVEPNPGRGREILTAACTAREANACQYLGGAYLEGKPGFDRDVIAARRFLDEACRLGFDLGCEMSRLPPPRSQ